MIVILLLVQDFHWHRAISAQSEPVPVAQTACDNRQKLLLALVLTCHADFSKVSQAGTSLDVSQMIILLSATSVSLSY